MRTQKKITYDLLQEIKGSFIQDFQREIDSYISLVLEKLNVNSISEMQEKGYELRVESKDIEIDIAQDTLSIKNIVNASQNIKVKLFKEISVDSYNPKINRKIDLYE